MDSYGVSMEIEKFAHPHDALGTSPKSALGTSPKSLDFKQIATAYPSSSKRILRKINETAPDMGFPDMKVPLVIIHFRLGSFLHKPTILGISMYGNPIKHH